MKYSLLTITIIALLSLQSVYAQTDCCNNPGCQAEARRLVTNIGKAVQPMGAYPVGLTQTYEVKKRFLDSLKANNPSVFTGIKRAVTDIHNWMAADTSRRVCIAHEYAQLSADALKWVSYFVPVFYTSSFRSPEFAKGLALHILLNAGASKLFTHNERFVSTGALLLSYTFTPKGQNTAGRVRLMVGPSFFYSTTKTYLMINPRAEFRIADIGGELTSLGCIKLFAQGNFQKNISMAGAGAALEISKFSLQVSGDYEFKSDALILQAGIAYAIHFGKK